MQCVPLYSLLAAVSARTVNYLSLDIEGVEFEVNHLYNSNIYIVYIVHSLTVQVLKTIPWSEVDIEVVTVEVNHAGEVAAGSEEEIRGYLAARGYVYYHTVGMDAVFIRRDCYEVSSV